MEKLLSELLNWDQEKEDRYKEAVRARDEKIKMLMEEREAKKQEKKDAKAKKLAEARAAKAAAEMGSQSGSDKGDDDKPPAMDDPAEDGGETPPDEAVEEPPIEIELQADSDDDFQPIEIKEKVKTHIREHGLSMRIPQDIINEAVRWRLERNDCQNRGYVLDGYPKNMFQADAVFMYTPEPPKKEVKLDDEGNPIEEEENEDENKVDLTPKLRTSIYPESVISLKASEQALKRRAKAALLNKTTGFQRYTGSKMADKLKSYSQENDLTLYRTVNLGKTLAPNKKKNLHYPTNAFFQENGTEVFEFLVRDNKFEMFESMRIYIERNGRPHNYLTSIRKLNDEREHKLLQEEEIDK